MKQTIYKSDFCNQFRVMGRLNNFSYAAREMLFDYLEECEEMTGEEIEMDVISVCCDFSEDSIETIAEQYNIDISDCVGEDEIKQAVLDYLEASTSVIGETEHGAMIVYATSF